MTGRRLVAAVLRALVLLAVVGAGLGLFHPDSPVPDGWKPLAPLAVADAPTPLTQWKLSRAAADPAACLAALAGAADVRAMEDADYGGGCAIRGRVELSRVGGADIASIETSCAVALRTAMWERHALGPAAQEIVGAALTRIEQIGSYNCRRIRTPGGGSQRLSTHATAEAIDITGFRFADGRRMTLIGGWDGAPEEQAFLRAARDGACRWFATTLGPDYNALHADHFHLQSRGWGTCR